MDTENLGANYSIQDETKPLITPVVKQTLPFYIKLVYGFPSLPLSLATNFVTTYIFFYYTDTVGVPLELLNRSYIITLFFLLFFFPVLGWFFDITHTRFGRRRPYLIFGAPALYFACVIVWIPPSSFPSFLTNILSREMLYCLWYSIWYGLGMIIQYVVQTPYIALGVEMTMDFEERSSLYGYSQAFYVIGMVLATGVPELGLKYYSNAKNLFFYLSLVAGALGVLSIEFMCWVIHERPDFIRKETTPLISGIRAAILENKPFVVLLIVITFQNSAPYTLSLLPYWVQYTLELNDLWGFIIITTFIATGFLFIPFWNLIARLWGKRKAYAFACIFGFFGYTMMMIPGPGQKAFALLAVIVSGASGMFLTNSNFLYQSLQGDCMDYDEFRTGMRREALYSNIMQFFNWYMSMFSTSAPFLVLQLLGFSADQAQPKLVRLGLGAVVGSSGLFALAAGIVLLAFYPITKQKYLQILSGIKQHEMGMEVKDMFSSQTIPSPNKMKEDERETFWLLYAFAHWELRKSVQSGTFVLKKLAAIHVLIWGIIFAGGAAGWHYNVNFYYIWAYLALLALYMVAYHLLRLRAAYQVNRRRIKTEEIENYLSYKLYL